MDRRKMRRAICAAVAVALAGMAPAGPLEEYVAKKDEAFSCEIHSVTNVLGASCVNVRLVSQEWRGMHWKHWLAVMVPPDTGDHQKGVLIVEGGKNGDGPPDLSGSEAMTVAMTAMHLKAPVAILLQVPNQPLFGRLKEDDLIAHTFDRYLKEEDAEWPLLLPMVKSATRAMDALQQLAGEGKLKTPAGAAVRWNEFLVAGASKRGWTTWLTGATDPRVCAIAPSVIDVLNMPSQMERQRKTYGTLSRMIQPYTKREIPQRQETDAGKRLNAIVDPWAYREKLTLPKLVVLGTNDPYWTADAAELYFPGLKGPKALFYLPNAGHGLGIGVLPTVNAFMASVLEEKPFPVLRSSRKGTVIEVAWEAAGDPGVWSAASGNRDFREAKWAYSGIEGEKRCRVVLEEPEAGWAASFVAVTFPGIRPGDPRFQLSTPIAIVPEHFPHE